MINLVLNINNYFFNLYSIPYMVVGILTFSEGIFIFIQNRKSLINFSYAVSCVAVMLWLVGIGAMYCSLNESVSLFWARYICYLGIIFITPTIYFFSVAWQKPLLSSVDVKRKFLSVIFNFFFGFLLYLFCISSMLVIDGLWKYYWGFYPKAGRFHFILIIWFLLLMTYSIKNFIYVYKVESVSIKKKQAKLIIIAFSIAFVGSLEFLPNYGAELYLFAFIPVLTCITIVGYSIIRYRLMDIETVVHKTVAWGFTNFALLIPFLLLGYFIKSWYAKLSFLPAVGFLAAISLTFLFFIKLLQPKVDNFFQRRRYNLEEIALQFTEDLVHLRGLNQLIQRIENTITNTLYPPVDIFIYNESLKNYKLANAIAISKKITELTGEDHFLLWLAKNDKIAYREFIDIDPAYAPIRTEANNYFNFTDATMVIPLVLNEKLLGVINLGKKANLQRYTAADFHFLSAIKNQSTIALSNSLLYENIEEQVRQRTKELVDIQRQLIQAEKLASVGTLAGGVAHEINNPLTAILTNIQMLLASRDGQFDRESLELIEEATKRCRTIVQKLMAYAKKPLETAQVSEVDLSNVIKNVVSFIGYQLEQDNIKIITEIKEGSYLVMGNQNELEQVVTNIILNARDAIKQIKKSGEIYVSLVKKGDRINIIIKDGGIGIPKDMLSKIFDPFFTTKEVGKGTGLGLSICQAIVEKHNGVITVQSELNKGATFTVQIPQAEVKSKVKHA
ncbi:MAG: ATP-binding protein [Candidatus Omnitrophota bacterium]|nr:ATP-binding protein [Candidatus Omnitrophota bacterium]